MIKVELWQLICAVLASAMGGATLGFLFCAILANHKFREMQYRQEEEESK